MNLSKDVIFSIDWITLTVFCDRPSAQVYLDLLGVEKTEVFDSSGIFGRIERGLHGFQVRSEPITLSKDGSTFVSMVMPGQFLQHVGMSAIEALYDQLIEDSLGGRGYRVTRLDLAFDTQQFRSRWLTEAYGHGLIEGRFRPESVKENGSAKEREAEKDEHTIYFGARTSDFMLRVYNKLDGDSFGDKNPFTRLELELKRVRADLIFHHIMSVSRQEMPQIAGWYLTGFIQVDCPFWHKLVEGLRSCWIKLHRKRSSVEKINRWLRDQVLPSLTTYVTAVSEGDIGDMSRLLNEMYQAGVKRLTPQHKRLIFEYEPTAVAPTMLRYGKI